MGQQPSGVGRAHVFLAGECVKQVLRGVSHFFLSTNLGAW